MEAGEEGRGGSSNLSLQDSIPVLWVLVSLEPGFAYAQKELSGDHAARSFLNGELTLKGVASPRLSVLIWGW